MKVILTQDVKSLGRKGELVTTSDGYARNYLFPRKLAVEANSQSMTELQNRESSKQHKIAVDTQAASDLAKQIDETIIEIKAKAGAGGRLFGSVTSKEIAEALNKRFSTDIDKKKITAPEIKAYGSYKVSVKLYQGISAEFTVKVSD